MNYRKNLAQLEVIYSKTYYVREKNGVYLLMRTQNYVSFGGLQQELESRDIMISEHETLEDAHAAMLAAAQSYVDMVKVGI